MMHNRNAVLERLKQLPVIDVHTHFERYLDTFDYTMPQFLYYCSYMVCYEADFDPEDVRLLHAPDAREESQFMALLRMLERLRFSRTASLARRIAELAGFPLIPGSFPGLMQWYQSRTAAQAQAAALRIRGYVANSAGHPLYGGVPGLRDFLNGTRKEDPLISRTLTVTGLHSIHTVQELTDLGQAAGMEIGSFSDWEKACQKLIAGFVDLGIAAFKELYLYFRPPQIDLPDWEAAGRQFTVLRQGGPPTRNLMDAMLFRVYEMMAAAGLPVQVHTGATLDSAEAAGYLWDLVKLMQAFPQMKFDLLHLNYPLLEPYLQVLRSCPNTYGDTTWIITTDLGCVCRYLDWAVDVLPIERTCFFGSDRHCAGFPVAAALEQADEVLTTFFVPRIERGQLSLADAEEIARRWLYENPKTLFHL